MKAFGVIAIEGRVPGPHHPHDAGHFVGQRHRRLVMAGTGFGLQRPALQFG